MGKMTPTYYVAHDGRRFVYREHTLDTDPMYTRGRTSLPANGAPYRIEFEFTPSPKFSKDDDLEDVIHNLMCFYEYDDIDALNEFKERAKTGMDIYPNHFLYRFMVAAVNLTINDLASWCNEFKKKVFEHPVTKDKLASIATLMAIKEDVGVGSDVVMKILEKLIKDPSMDFADAYETSLPVMVEAGELEGIVREVLDAFPKKVEEYRKGKKGMASMFIGEVMRKKKGLDPKSVKETIEKELNRITVGS